MSHLVPKTFRLALYGRTGSGKTCILAALAMSRPPHPRGYTGTRIHPDPTDKTRHAAQVAGDEWLEVAITRIAAGDIPEMNLPGDKPTDRILGYSFTATEVPEFRVELFDYSGELINPVRQKNPEELAAQLLKHLATMDGLLLLVEAPRGEGHDAVQTSEVRHLTEAFTEVKTAQAIPLALMVTKWDRQASLKDTTPVMESERLAVLLNSTAVPALTKLRDAIRNAVGEANLRVFPVSAFGDHELRNGHDYPKAGVPHAFGLEDPFIWVAARRDALELEALEHQVEAMKGLGVLSPRRWRNRGVGLGNRFRPETPERARVVQLRRRRRWFMGRFLAVAVVIVALLGLSLERRTDVIGYRTVRLAELPAATEQEAEAAKTWLRWYSTSGPFRHMFSKLIFNQDDARKKIKEIEEQEEARAWSIVEALKPDLLKQEQPVDQYLKKFPGGSHASDARKIKLEVEDLLASRQNEEQVERAEHRVQGLAPDAEINVLRQVLDEVEVPLPRPKVATESQRLRLQAVAEILRTRLRDQMVGLDRKSFRKIFDEHLAKDRLKDIAYLLTDRQPKDEFLLELQKQFQTEAPKRIDRRIDELTAGDIHWADAKDFLNECDHWPAKMQSQNLTAHIKKARKTVEVRQDKWLYEQVSKYRREKEVDAYLELAPIGSMSPDVKKYKTYLTTRQGKLKLALSLDRIHWSENCWNNSYNIVTVYVNNVKAIEKTGITSHALYETKGFGTYQFEHPLDQRIHLEIKIINDDYFIGGGDHNHGEASSSERIEDLAKGQSLDLRFNQGVNRAVLRVTGLPKEPQLPAWIPKP